MYPLYYITKSGTVMCPDCANDDENTSEHEDDPIEHVEINHEDYNLQCDVCYKYLPDSVHTDEEQLELRLTNSGE